MPGKKITERELHWRQVLERQADSGLSIRKFCANEGVSQASFFAWRRKLREQGGGTPLRKSKQGGRQSGVGRGFIPLSLVDSAHTLEIVHPNGCQIRVTGEVNVQTLRQVLDALDRGGDR